MILLADEGIDKPIVDILRLCGFNVHYILETHQGIDDEQVLQIANKETRILLTQDKDFGELVYRFNKAHFGIILVRLGELPASEKAIIVNNVVLKYKQKLENAFTVIQHKTVRIRK